MIAEPDELMKVLNNERANISKTIKSYIKSNWKSLNIHSVDISYPNSVTCKSVEFDHIRVVRVDTERVYFTADASIEIKMTGMSVHGPAKDTDFIWLRLDCSCSNSEPGIYCFESKVICQLGTEPHETVYSLPHITDKNADDYAELFLEKNCPDALKTPIKINVKELAAKMGLTITEQNDSSHTADNFRLDGDIGTGKSFCTLIFEAKNSDDMRDIDSTGTIKRLKKGTITINPSNEKYNFFGTHDIAVLNQLIHWMFHHKYFETLQSGRYDNPTEMPGNYTYLVADNLTCSHLMEPQSMMLIPRIMIPAKTGRDKFQSIYDDVKANDPQLRSAVIMEKAVELFAGFYGVPVQMAKQRAVDLGFEQAGGTFIVAGGKKCPPVSFSSGSLTDRQTFFVDHDLAVKLFQRDRLLSFLIGINRVVYANGVWVRNNPKYLSVSGESGYVLTDYGIEHLEECAIIFEYKTSLPRMYNLTKGECVDYDFNVVKRNSEKIKRNAEFRKFKAGLPYTFSGALEKIMERTKEINKTSQEKIAAASRLSKQTIIALRKGTKKPDSLSTVLCLCIGMNLEPELSRLLISRANMSLPDDPYVQSVYNDLIEEFYEEDIDAWNVYLETCGLPMLGSSNSSEAEYNHGYMIEELKKLE